ncbi:MAG: PhzF family phenazine biosynthesis protein [Defluviitaleaceae bacterium]|nr:PhzF family phenazine biosynthesis protein [Defluviitaleaceae bacterium]
MQIFTASAFSKNGAGGNMAGVCLHGEKLDRQQKMAIAKLLGFSETAYVTVSKNKFKFEYFTPCEEVPLCGHATIAAFVVMRGELSLDNGDYLIETGSGDLSVTLDDDMVFMEQNPPQFFEALSKSDVAKCFDIDVLSDELPIKIGSTGLRDIMLPIKNLETLQNMNPNFVEISNLSRRFNTVGIHAFAIDGERIICRNFAPLYGIPEESATGTSNCVLASYLWQKNIMRKSEYIFEQGYALGSPSEIIVRLRASGDNIDKIAVGGMGYQVSEQPWPKSIFA